MDLQCVTIDPKAPHQHTHTAIFLHGRGDNADNFAASLIFSRTRSNQTLFSSLPTFRWVFPTSEMRAAGAEGGKLWSQWFDIFNFWDFGEREQEVAGVGLRESVASVMKIIEREVEQLGGRWERVVLLGISQGGAVGMHVLLNLGGSVKGGEGVQGHVVGESSRSKEQGEVEGEAESVVSTSTGRLGAFVAFSSWLPYVGRSLPEMRKALDLGNTPNDTFFRSTPVLMEHCADDWTVKFHHGVAARDAFKSFGLYVDWREYWDGGHWFKAPEGIEDAVEFLKKNVPGLEAED